MSLGLFKGGYSASDSVLAGIGRDLRIESRCICLGIDKSDVSLSEEEFESLDDERRPLILRYFDFTWWRASMPSISETSAKAAATL